MVVHMFGGDCDYIFELRQCVVTPTGTGETVRWLCTSNFGKQESPKNSSTKADALVGTKASQVYFLPTTTVALGKLGVTLSPLANTTVGMAFVMCVAAGITVGGVSGWSC